MDRWRIKPKVTQGVMRRTPTGVKLLSLPNGTSKEHPAPEVGERQQDSQVKLIIGPELGR
jgi:hypothetical protein